MVDTTNFNWIPAGQTNVTTNASYGVWSYYRYDASTASITVENPPPDLDAIVQSGATPWWPRTYKVLHLRISPGGAEAGRFGQQLLPSEKTGPVTMSAYVKILAGTLSIGREGRTQDLANSTWQRVSVTNDPLPTLGGYWVFAASPTTFTEALIALPKVEQGATASPWIEGQDPTTAVSAPPCTPGWDFLVTGNTGATLCTVSLQVPWDAVIEASLVGFIRSLSDGHRCTAGISIDDDIPANRDMCCDTAALQPILFHPASDIGHVPATTKRTKNVAAGTRVVRAWLNSTTTSGCKFDGSSLTVTAHRR